MPSNLDRSWRDRDLMSWNSDWSSRFGSGVFSNSDWDFWDWNRVQLHSDWGESLRKFIDSNRGLPKGKLDLSDLKHEQHTRLDWHYANKRLANTNSSEVNKWNAYPNRRKSDIRSASLNWWGLVSSFVVWKAPFIGCWDLNTTVINRLAAAR